MEFTAKISKEKLEEFIDSYFEGSYKPNVKDLKITPDLGLEVDFVMVEE